MFMQKLKGSSERRSATPEETLAALHAAGPGALAELLGDVDFLLTAIATAPEEMFEAGERPRDEYNRLLETVHDSRSSLDALEARAVVALAEATRRDQIRAARDDAAHEDEFLPSHDRLNRLADGRTRRDYSLTTRRSPSAAERSLASARRMVRSMPRMLCALGTGKVTAQVAYAAASAMEPLDDLQRRQLDETLHEQMPRLDGAGVQRWRDEVASAIGQLDPQGAAARHHRARRGRHVTFTPGQHGMATVSAQLPALEAKLVHKRLSLEAERLRAEGARQGHGALMADAFVDTLIGRGGGMDPVLLEIGLIMTERSLLSPDHGDVAHIEGYGSVPVGMVREQLRLALAEPDPAEGDRCGPDGPPLRPVMRRLFTHPTSGELVAVESRARAFPPALARFLDWRDLICRAPFCDAAVRQHDHIVPASAGGATSIDNGQGLCAHCNLSKESDTAGVRRLPEASRHLVEWTGSSGITRVTSPSPLGPTGPAAGTAAATDPAGPAETAAAADVITGVSDSAPCDATSSSLTVRIPLDAQHGPVTPAAPAGARTGADPQPVKARGVRRSVRAQAPVRTVGRRERPESASRRVVPEALATGGRRAMLRPPTGAATPWSHRAAATCRRPQPRVHRSPTAPRRRAAPPAALRNS
ncbi:HNH endonuclease [Brachybacterium vulturis]|uniref:HNH endonuclease n=1 Tax=Brachybacterium vulturis TaxID=2017484 RepID=A0A291GLG9_9MICO|nr:HNH endonuclease [Brachybacterium vulturis]